MLNCKNILMFFFTFQDILMSLALYVSLKMSHIYTTLCTTSDEISSVCLCSMQIAKMLLVQMGCSSHSPLLAFRDASLDLSFKTFKLGDASGFLTHCIIKVVKLVRSRSQCMSEKYFLGQYVPKQILRNTIRIRFLLSLSAEHTRIGCSRWLDMNINT